jgi:hypothetical protein
LHDMLAAVVPQGAGHWFGGAPSWGE